MKIAVLGAGMVGRAMALDLATMHEVTSFDISEKNLLLLRQRNAAIQTQVADLLLFDQYNQWLLPYDMVVTAVPGWMGYKTLEAVISSGKNTCDISFFPEDALGLDALAKEKKVTVITDIGVAPGMSNLILGYYNAIMEVEAFDCYVGGLPQHPQAPYYYKAPFSPIDVIEEYIRPARLQENGKIVTKPALTDREKLYFDGVGTLEAFNTDGLRSLLYTMSHIPDMKEKTLRYPGHLDLILALKDSGFFSTSPIMLENNRITPLAFTSRMLIEQWKLGETEEELTVMKVIVKGKQNGGQKIIEYNLLDKYDHVSRVSSMARTTGYTCTAAVHLLQEGLFKEKGVFPPEKIGSNPLCFEYILAYLAKRNVHWVKTEL